MAGHATRRLDHLQVREPAAVPQVEGAAAPYGIVQCEQVRRGQVLHVDVIADACAVASGVIIAEERYRRPLSQPYLQDAGDEVGFWAVVLATLFCCTGCVEVP